MRIRLFGWLLAAVVMVFGPTLVLADTLRLIEVGTTDSLSQTPSTPAPAPEATEPADVTLTETYFDEDIPLTFDFPAGWVVRAGSPNGVDLANSEAALDLRAGNTLAPGDMRAFIGYGPALDQLDGLEVESLTPAEIFEVGFASELPPDVMVGEIEEFSVNDRRAAALTMTTKSVEGFLVLADYGNGYYLTADIYTATGELEPARALLLAMLETVDVRAVNTEDNFSPALDATYRSDDGRLSIAYPEGWFVRPGYPFTVDIANTEAGLDLWLFDTFAPGDVRLAVGVGTGEEVFEGFDTTGLDVVEMTAIMAEAEAEDERVLNVTEPEALTINGQPAAAATLTLAESENYAVIIEYDGFYAIASVQTPLGELEAGQRLLLSMLETLEVGL